jgi:hypothetical protein
MTMGSAAPFRFQLVLPPGGLVTDPTAVWRPVAGPSSFSVPGEDEPPAGCRWMVDLPANVRLAVRILDGKAQQLAAAESALGMAARQLSAFVHQARDGGPPGADFSAADGDEVERDLADWLATMRGETSFAWGESGRHRWRESVREVGAFFAQVAGALTAFAIIETAFDGVSRARTRVGWSGTTETVWSDRPDPARAGLHFRVVGLTLATRRSWLGLIGELVRGAIELGTLLAAPGGWRLAIPAAWRAFRRISGRIDEVHGAEAG